MRSSARTIGQVWHLILHGNLARIALGIRLLYVCEVCLGGQTDSHRDCIDDCVFSDVPVGNFSVTCSEGKLSEGLRYRNVYPGLFSVGTSCCTCCYQPWLCMGVDICARDYGFPYVISSCSFS